MKKTRSEELFSEALQYFPGGVHSPVRAFKSVEGSPLFMKSGSGSRITDVDGNTFIDFCCSWGPLILGHSHPEVIKEILQTVQRGTSFGAPSEMGNKIGAFIINNHRYIDKIRFVSSGTEAVMSAVRLARAYSGKQKIIKFEGCYHGHVDALMVKAGSGLTTLSESTSAGIPPQVIADTIVLPLADLHIVEETLKKQSSEIAALIIEPIPANNGLLIQDASYLEGLRTLTKKYEVLLIFDEVISGFRIGFEGAAGFYGIQPDILTFGKIIGGGMPVGAYASSHEIMRQVAPDGPMYQAGTLSANPVAMVAGYTTLKILLEENIYPSLAKSTEQFINRIRKYIDTHALPCNVQSIGSIFWLSFSKDRINHPRQIPDNANQLFRSLHRNLLNSGVYIGPSAYEVGFVSSVHSEDDLEIAAEVICIGLSEIFE